MKKVLADYVDRMEQALKTAADLDEKQEHDEAAEVLRTALFSSPSFGDETPEEMEQIRQLAQRCGAEEQRQDHRAALLASYLNR